MSDAEVFVYIVGPYGGACLGVFFAVLFIVGRVWRR